MSYSKGACNRIKTISPKTHMNPRKLINLVTGVGWVLGKFPGRPEQSSAERPDESKAKAKNGQRSGLAANHRPKQADLEVLPEYELARDLIKNEIPLLIVTGGAGTGKITFIRWLARSFEGHVLIAAPTGIAALNVDGKTLHSMCVLPPAWILPEDCWRRLKADHLGLSCSFFEQGRPGVINVGTMSKWRRLVIRDGMSLRQASLRLGICRNTAAKWLSEPEMVEPKYPVRQVSASVLDPF